MSVEEMKQSAWIGEQFRIGETTAVIVNFHGLGGPLGADELILCWLRCAGKDRAASSSLLDVWLNAASSGRLASTRFPAPVELLREATGCSGKAS